MNPKLCLFAGVPLCLLLAGCGHPTPSRSTTAVNLRFADTKYVLPVPETDRFRAEARRAKQAGNREVCGALVRSGDGSLALCFADNDSHVPHSFQISHGSLSQMREVAGMTSAALVGSFHSHPSGIAVPGEADLQGEAVNNLMMIHSCLTGRIRLWKVAAVNGKREAIEIPLEVHARRARSASPLAPSKSVRGIARDVRAQK